MIDTKTTSRKRLIRAKLIFNPGSGETGQSPIQLMDIISALQSWKIVPEAFLVEPGCDLAGVVRAALENGIRLFVVCGGDGTVDFIAGELAGTQATLGIIPTGTQNNVAFSLGIPMDIPSAIALLRIGQRVKVDVGMAVCGENKHSFFELCSVGLLSALFPVADDIQHGNIGRIGDFLGALVSAPPAQMHLVMDGKDEITTNCHVVLVTNTPFIGPHFQIGNEESIRDGLLDVILFADLSKIDLLGYAVQLARDTVKSEDERILHYHVRNLVVDTQPSMLVMADGNVIGEGPVQIQIRRHALKIMIARPAPSSPLLQQNEPVIPADETEDTAGLA